MGFRVFGQRFVSFFRYIQPQAGLPFVGIRPMAIKAFVGKDRPDVKIIAYPFVFRFVTTRVKAGGYKNGKEYDNNDNGKKEDFFHGKLKIFIMGGQILAVCSVIYPRVKL
jgi:hypothetical protein